ncbi:hypothetical protein DFJ58DRAFT_194800 [Suillus subalutaceus]|uniref:uncharacterized protein n=1 Tax=Suillus subalutaceus TaxID=48586 RepID=UPI001B87A052|nr:uncharacterized protein DFJ58DRAFT_194800 [Suillus subalutaceus]KAG1864671.1 hypothetical protein DFJ58DRAFT_194800 [Suillus subalutaceus]
MHWVHHVCRLPVRTCNVFLIFLPCASYVFCSSSCVSYHHDVPSNPRTTLEYFSHSKMKLDNCTTPPHAPHLSISVTIYFVAILLLLIAATIPSRFLHHALTPLGHS